MSGRANPVSSLLSAKLHSTLSLEDLSLKPALGHARFSNAISQQLVDKSHQVIKDFQSVLSIKGSIEPALVVLRHANQELLALAKGLTSSEVQEEAKEIVRQNLLEAIKIFKQAQHNIEAHPHDRNNGIDASLIEVAQTSSYTASHALSFLTSLILFSNEEHDLMVKRLSEVREQLICKITSEHMVDLNTRPFFHLAHIHKNEEPGKWNEAADYGLQAFCQQPLAVLDDRRRAIRRTEVEVVLYGLEQAIRTDQFKEVNFYLSFLEKTCLLAPTDSLEGTDNVAHQLFLRLYETYKHDSDKEGSSLAKPQEDFGRTTFTSQAPNPHHKHYKLLALAKVIHDLKTAWKL